MVPRGGKMSVMSRGRTTPVMGGGKMRLVPLIAATYFMVSGGPYGLEDIIGEAGYGWALVMLLVVPVVWSLPTSLMVGELASAVPEEGGYYRWVRRALGEFWGFQEAWLSLAASVFDMAIYPTIFVLYLGRIEPAWTAGYRGTGWALAVVVGCAVWNLRGARAVGEGSVGLFCVLLSPFVVLTAVGLWKGLVLGGHGGSGSFLMAGAASLKVGLFSLKAPGAGFAGAVSVTLWNYMGWDNASTVAQEVEEPQRNYPRAMLTAAGAGGVDVCVATGGGGTGGDSGGTVFDGGMGGCGEGVGGAVAGAVCGAGWDDQWSGDVQRADDELYAGAVCAGRGGSAARGGGEEESVGGSWVSVVVCSVGWALALRLSFERLISIDLVLYGAALLLEFVALVVLRVKEPGLARPFKVPGGVWGTVAMGVGPAGLIVFALWAARGERVAGLPALGFAGIVAVAGPVVYVVAKAMKRAASATTPSV